MPRRQKKPTKSVCLNIARGKKAAQKTRKETSDLDISAWFWFFLCGECTKEDMIKCSACMRWVHDACAGINANQMAYLCDMCRNK